MPSRPAGSLAVRCEGGSLLPAPGQLPLVIVWPRRPCGGRRTPGGGAAAAEAGAVAGQARGRAGLAGRAGL